MSVQKAKSKVAKMTKQIIEKQVRKDKYPGPPICCGLLHQPKRPKN